VNIELIPAIENDRAFFRSAHHLAYRAVIESMFGWNEDQQDISADKEFIERNPHIVRFEDKAVGAIGWEYKADYLWFGPIYILPEFQNKGLGSFLVKKFMKDAQDKGMPLRLRTLLKNDGAKRLYMNLGFKVLSSTDIHWHMEYKSAPGERVL